MNKAKLYLQSCGHIVVNCEPPDDLKCQELWNGLTQVHEHRHFLQNESGTFESSENVQGKISPRVLWTDEARHVKNASSNQSICKRLTEKLESIPGIKSSKDKAIERMHTTMNSDCDLWNTASLREQFVDEVLNNMNKLQVDVMICPVFGSPASTPEQLTKMGLRECLLHLRFYFLSKKYIISFKNNKVKIKQCPACIPSSGIYLTCPLVR